jgi:hypothetical protein
MPVQENVFRLSQELPDILMTNRQLEALLQQALGTRKDCPPF